MVEVVLVVREVGRNSPDYSLHFELPVLPREGDYISINRPDHPEPYSEDVIVRHVWWRLHHPETRASFSGDEKPKVGRLTEIFVECDVALGPYAADHWRKYHGNAPKFDVSRFAVSEADFKGKK